MFVLAVTPEPGLTRLQQRIIEKQKQKEREEANGPQLLFKKSTEPAAEPWVTLSQWVCRHRLCSTPLLIWIMCRYAWEDAGKKIHIYLTVDDIENPQEVHHTLQVFEPYLWGSVQAAVSLRPEFDSFWFGIQDGKHKFALQVVCRYYCLYCDLSVNGHSWACGCKVENLKHDIIEDKCTVKWKPSSKRATITLTKDDSSQEWRSLCKGGVWYMYEYTRSRTYPY